MIKEDRINLELLACLQADSHRPIAALAADVGCSTTACWRRIQAFHDDGLVLATPAILDRTKLGYGVVVFVQIKLEHHGSDKISQFYEVIGSIPEIVSCYAIFGSTDYILKVLADSIESYEKFFHKVISRLPAIKEAISSIAMREVKNVTTIPLGLSPGLLRYD